MNTLSSRTLSIALAVIATAACSSSNLTPPSHDAGTDTLVVPNACLGNPPSAVPDLHRPAATACTPSTQAASVPGTGSCVTDADCAVDGSATHKYQVCTLGKCSLDQCLTDADCLNGGVCVCAGTFYGGNAIHGNLCITGGNCRVDGDCGPGRYCSPSVGTCGGYEGYFCHTAHDTCVDATKDCGGCGNSCSYMPTVGGFVCSTSVCNG